MCTINTHTAVLLFKLISDLFSVEGTQNCTNQVHKAPQFKLTSDIWALEPVCAPDLAQKENDIRVG